MFYDILLKSMNTNNTEEKKELEVRDVQRELVEEIDELNQEMHKQNSGVRIFWTGILRGLGTAIGATLLFGVIITVLSLIVNGTESTWIQMIADWIRLESYSS